MLSDQIDLTQVITLPSNNIRHMITRIAAELDRMGHHDLADRLDRIARWEPWTHGYHRGTPDRVDRIAQSSRGWIDPDGNYHPVGEQEHPDWAKEHEDLFDEDLPDLEGIRMNEFIIGKGWIHHRSSQYQIGSRNWQAQLRHVCNDITTRMHDEPEWRYRPLMIEVFNESNDPHQWSHTQVHIDQKQLLQEGPSPEDLYQSLLPRVASAVRSLTQERKYRTHP